MDSDNSRKRKRSSLAAAPPTDHESGEESSSSDMGVIKRKNIVKGNEGGLKYICDVCSADITSTNNIPYRYTQETGAPMRNYFCSKAWRYTGLAHGRMLQIMLADSERKRKSAITISRHTSRALNSLYPKMPIRKT
ncbi:MAG: hypothetical protein Q9177_004299 [Variospora cf. flavescens]